MSDQVHEAAAGLLADLGIVGDDEEVVEAQETVSGPEDAVAPQAQETDEDNDYDPEVPDEIQALLDTPDEEDVQPYEVSDEIDEYEDPQLAAERRARIAAERKAEYERNLRLSSDRKKWESEASKFFPLAGVQTDAYQSRRSFLKAAKADHEMKKPLVEKYLSKERERMQSETERIKSEIRAELEEAWGRPTTGPVGAPDAAARSAANDDLEQARARRDINGVIKALTRSGKVRI